MSSTIQRRTSPTSPYDVLKSHSTQLIDAITSPNQLANALSAANLISGPVKNRVLEIPNDNYGKASALVNDFLNSLKVFNEQKTLVRFCGVLKDQDNPNLDRIATNILNELGIDEQETQPPVLNNMRTNSDHDQRRKDCIYVIILVTGLLIAAVWYVSTVNKVSSDNTYGDQSVVNKGTSTVDKLKTVDETGGYIPNGADLLYHLSELTQIHSFCSSLGLGSECNVIARYHDDDEQKSEMLRRWQQLKRRTWKDFIRPFALLKNCVKARELAKEHSVKFYSDDERVLSNCEDINDK